MIGCATIARTSPALAVIFSLLLNIQPSNKQSLFVEAVNYARYDKLQREELLDLDRETTNFYYETYEQLDARNSTYEEQLYRSMKSARHTLVINHFDYMYNDIGVMQRAVGPKADIELCKIHLQALVNMAKAEVSSLPLSARNFFESYGRSEAGVLDGNFVWLGSYENCLHASIPALSARPYLSTNATQTNEDINPRYCVAHMKAKSWPSWDKYFETMLRLRVGICLPESCHSIHYNRSTEVQEAVDRLTRSNLLEPFKGDTYEVTYLYCLPDEDSPLRQWDLGAKLFFAFVSTWVLVLAYLNIRYYQRERTVRRLRESVDIKLIISERREASATSDSEETSPNISERRSVEGDNYKDQSAGGDAGKSNDGESRVISPITERKIKSSQQNVSKEGQGFDVIKAFSIEANLKYLLHGRDNEQRQRRNDEIAAHGQASFSGQRCSLPQSHLLSAVNRRTSASNEALIKDLRHQEDQGEAKSKLAVISAEEAEALETRSRSNSKTRRVNLDIFDGIKAFFTVYIVFGHTLMFFFGIVKDLKYSQERMLDLTLVICLNTLHVVSIFYIITGILLTYLVFKRQKGNQLYKPQFWFMVILNRYLRLIPLYFMVFWFAKHIAPLTGSGNIWYDYRTHSEHVRAYCSEEPWSTMLTISAADVKIPRDCVPQTWYLSNDFRTLFILPFYIILLAKNRILGYSAIVVTFLISWARITSTLREANIDYKVIVHWKPHVYSLMTDRLHDVYTDLTIRLSTYLLGVVVGHVLYMYETRQIKQLPRWFINHGMKLSFINAAIFFMGAPIIASPLLRDFMPKQDEIDSDTLIVLIPIFKTFMELSVSAVLLLLSIGGGFKLINRLLSSNISKLLANISYGVFLMHIELMYKVHIARIDSSYWSLYVNSAFIIMVCNLLSMVTHLTFEMPVNNLVRYFFQKLIKSASI